MTTTAASPVVPAGAPSPAAAAGRFYSVDFISPDIGWAAGAAGIFSTTNGGQSWALQYPEQPDSGAGAVQFLDSKTGLALGNHGLMSTTDGGQRWGVVSVDSENNPAHIDFVTATTGWVIGATHRGTSTEALLGTDDGGWTYREVMSPAESVCFGDERHGWVANGHEVKRTVDGGATWATSFTNPVEDQGDKVWAPTLQCAGSDVAWLLLADGVAAGSEGYAIYDTVDGGQHWHPVVHGPMGPVHDGHVGAGGYPGPISVLDGSNVFVVTVCSACNGDGTSSIEVTHDGGTTWQPPVEIVGAWANANSLDFVDADHGWLAADNGIFATTDGGAHWAKQDTTTPGSRLAGTTTPVSTPVVFPVAPAHHDAPVWEFVRQWQGANIWPILRPTYVPAGFDTVTIDQLPNKLNIDLLAVAYSGPRKKLQILAGPLNPGAGDSQRQVTVRGQDATLTTTRVEDAGGSASWISLSWQEPGLRVGQISPALYEVRGMGLTEQELLGVAESLTPIGP